MKCKECTLLKRVKNPTYAPEIFECEHINCDYFYVTKETICPLSNQ